MRATPDVAFADALRRRDVVVGQNVVLQRQLAAALASRRHTRAEVWRSTTAGSRCYTCPEVLRCLALTKSLGEPIRGPPYCIGGIAAPSSGHSLSRGEEWQSASVAQVSGVSLIAALSLLAAFQGRTLLSRVADLFPKELPPNPYFVPEHALLLYLGTGVVVVACVVTLLTPGLLAVLATGGERRAGALLLKSFGAAYALRGAAHAVALMSGAAPLTFYKFVVIELALDLPLAAIAIWRASRGNVCWPFAAAHERRRFAVALLVPAVLVTALLPLFFWQSLTSDGMEAVEIGYSLTWNPFPRFPNSLGIGSIAGGMTAMALPVHWFIQLIGPIEAAARLPFALYLSVLYVALTELIEWNAARRLRLREESVLLLALATYAVAMSYNSTYDPYSADIASPGAAFETLTVLCFAASVLFVWQNKLRWLMLFAAIGMFARPIELILLLGLAFGVVLAPGDRRLTQLRCIAYGIAVCIVIFVLHDLVWVNHVAGERAAAFGSFGQIQRWRFLTFTDGSRLLYSAIPAGLFPFLSLLFWTKQDRESRQLTVACVLYFALFYVQSFLAMHHFAPVMLLPLVVFWRTYMRVDQPWMIPLTAAVTAACLWLSLPRRFDIDRTARNVGCRTAYLAGDYMKDWSTHSATLRARGSLGWLFYVDSGAYPERDLLLYPGPVHYYAWRCGNNPATALYVAALSTSPPPEGMVRVASDKLVSLFVRDTVAWREAGRRPPPTDWRSPLFATPRATLHRAIGAPKGNYQLDMTTVPFLWRLFRSARKASAGAPTARDVRAPDSLGDARSQSRRTR